MSKSNELLIGNKYNHWTVIGGETRRNGNIYVLCKCICGKEKFVDKYSVKNGVSKSCHCHQKGNRNIKHGAKSKIATKKQKRLYDVWRGIKKRCGCETNKGYGGRGIKVCDEWSNDFQAFYDWAIVNGYDENAPRGKCTIERINNDGNYCPSNCRWATSLEQGSNKRNNTLIKIRNETKTLSQWCRIFKITSDLVGKRIKSGISPILALTNPIDERKARYKNKQI
jgi:hypothetical protein